MPEGGFRVWVHNIDFGIHQHGVSATLNIDIEVVKDISDEIVKALSNLLPQLSKEVRIPPKTAIKEIISLKTTRLFVARDVHNNNKIIGMLTLVIFPIPSGIRAWIEDVVVDSSVRKRGIGEQLTKSALKVARKLGANSVYLTSRPARTSANRLYQKLGFVKRETNLYCYRF